MIMRRTSSGNAEVRRASISLIVERLSELEVVAISSVVWDSIREITRDHPRLHFDSPVARVYSLESRSPTTAMADTHIREVLDRVASIEGELSSLVQRGSLLTLHCRIIGTSFCEPIEVPVDIVRRVARMGAGLHFCVSESKLWSDIAERLRAGHS
jgi:hypothetical protein